MAGISLVKTVLVDSGYSWVDLSAPGGIANYFHDSADWGKEWRTALKADFNLTSARSLIQCTLYARLATSSPDEGGTVTCYVYTSDPYAGVTVPLTSVPAGYIASANATIPANTSGYKVWDRSFTFSLNLTSAGSLYFLFSASRNAGTYGFFTGLYDQNYSMAQYTSVSGVFKPLPTSLNVTPSAVSTGGTINVSIGNYWTTETVKFYYGSTLLGSATITNGNGNVSIPKSWFTTAGITNSQSMTVQARLDGTSLTKNFTVQAGSDMKPTVGTPSLTLVQGSTASAFPSTYIANISKVKVRASVSAGSNAGISSVRVSWSGGSAAMSLVSGAYEATVGPIAGNTTFTVTATDARGMTQTASVSLTGVKSYSAPVITINESKTYRCNSGGTKTDGGTSVRAQAAVAVTTGLASGSSDNKLMTFRFYIQEEPSKSYPLDNNLQSDAKLGRAEDYYETLVFEATDRIQTVTRSIRLPPRTRNIAVKRSADGTYVGIGVLPQHTSGKSTLDLPEGGGYYEGGFLWGSLTRLNSSNTGGSQFSKNFKNVDTSILYADTNAECYFNMTSTSGWSNYPVSTTPFSGMRKVIWVSGSIYLIVILEFSPTPGRLWFSYNGGAWKSLTPA